MDGPLHEFSGRHDGEEGFVVRSPFLAQHARPGAQLRLWEALDEEPASNGIRREGYDEAPFITVDRHLEQ